MYCKHCGKEIADDSKFCQHCGGKLDNVVEVIKDETHIEKKVSKLFSSINKKYLYAYIIWVIINAILLCLGNDDYSTHKFYPFTGYYYSDSYGLIIKDYFASSYYDLSEFITYVILLPLLVWLLIKTYRGKVIQFVKFIKTYGLLILVIIVIIVASIIAISRCSDEDDEYVREYYQAPNVQTQQYESSHESKNSPQPLNVINGEKYYKEFDNQMKSINRQIEEIDNQMKGNKTIDDLPSYLDYYFP